MAGKYKPIAPRAKRIMNRTEMADYLGRDRKTLLAWEKKGFLIPTRMIDGRPYYTDEMADDFLARLNQGEAVA